MDDSDTSDYEDIRPLFTKAEWRQFSSYEKASYRNAKENYQAMQAAGFSPKLPQFMEASAKKKVSMKPKHRRRRKDEDSEEEEGVKQPPRSRRFTLAAPKPLRPSLPRATKAVVPVLPADMEDDNDDDEDEDVDVEDTDDDDEEDDDDVALKLDKGPVSRYPKRLDSRNKTYAGSLEDEEDLDVSATTTADAGDELYCDHCERELDGDCPVHGPPQATPDSKVP